MHKRDRLFYFQHEVPGPHGPFGMPFPGPGPFGGGGFRRGRRMRRGNVRAAILLLLSEEPRNGYQIMQELESRSGGEWRPSPGSVYPALQLLADEGLIRGETHEGGTVYSLTDAGRTHVDENRERFGEPWKHEIPEALLELSNVLGQVTVAAKQVVHAGTDEQRKAATELLAETRRKLYGILAGD
jgi:DNA-binding PadR family transcriptional regulator